MKDVKERKAIVLSIVEPMVIGERDWKVRGSYERMRPGKDGKVRTVLSPDTASGRLSSNDSILFEASTNLQNQENKIAKIDPLYQVRDVVEAPKGWTFVAGDLKNAEALLVAAYSCDWPFYDKIMNGADVHSEHAYMFWPDRLPKDFKRIKKEFSFERDIAKTLTYASFYLAMVRTLTISLNKEAEKLGKRFTEDEVAVLLKVLLSLHPLEMWWESVRLALIKGNGSLRNCFGYRRTFHQLEERSRLKDACNFLPQSTVAWLMNRAIPILYRTIDKPGVRELVHQVHDEALWLCREGEEENIVRLSTPVIEHRFTINDREIYIPVDFKIGRVWGQMQPYTV